MKATLFYLNTIIAAALILCVVCISCCHYPVGDSSDHSVSVSIEEKQRGVHVFGRMDSTTYNDLSNIHADWITLVPYAGQNGHDSPEISYFRSDDPDHIKERNDRWIRQIRATHEAGFKVFLKPHIWISNAADGKWRSDIYYDNEDEWNTWKENYRSFILHYAKMAEQADVEMFCIGVELTRLSKGKPEFWRTLIRDILLGSKIIRARWRKRQV